MSLLFLDEHWSWEMTLKKFIDEGNFHSSWKDFFYREDVYTELCIISEKLEKECELGNTIYPEINNVFRAFNLPLEEIKVVILGQDPYHNGNAVGLCFSVPKGVTINPSLKNMYKEMKDNGYKPKEDGNLEHLQKQGCLLLNTALTVEKGKPESHLKIWKKFTDLVVKEINNYVSNPPVWLIMGSKSLEVVNDIVDPKLLFITSHPSPFSAFKPFKQYPAFLGSGIFSKLNDRLGKNKLAY
jgi:uracil-DNA glycosylase